MTDTATLAQISPHVIADAARYAEQFARRDPFRHVVIDDFFAPGYAAQLLEEFPAFERGNARNENGEIGNKSTIERIRGLGAAYLALDELVKSPTLLDLVGRVTGIPHLLYDPWYFGGGTHENRDGQDLDPHVDFNRHPIESWHRRLNLIVYFNREWDDAWGGSLELHSDPRSPDDRTTLVTPLYNRCVIFETTETSWHGFTRIGRAPGMPPLSRKSIALYFYTKERPAADLAEEHSTIYVDRPLPERYHAGMTLDADDEQQLRILLKRRDQHNQRLYREITSLTSQLRQARDALSAGRLGRLEYFAKRFAARFQR
ncbi:MAG: 2OG-Fe(II) oxygenase [Rhodanobacteraceae bacterium]